MRDTQETLRLIGELIGEADHMDYPPEYKLHLLMGAAALTCYYHEMQAVEDKIIGGNYGES